MKQLVIMPGGFHPFHAGHAALYNSAREAFPGADVYVAATNDTSTRPFPFAIKEKLAKLAGVEPGHFVQVKSPFQALEIAQKFNPEDTQLIFVRSQKDADKPPKPGGVKKNGEPSYLQPYNKNATAPMSQQGYMAYLPTVEFGPGMTSATEIRAAWPKLNEKRRTALVMSLYPRYTEKSQIGCNSGQNAGHSHWHRSLLKIKAGPPPTKQMDSLLAQALQAACTPHIKTDTINPPWKTTWKKLVLIQLKLLPWIFIKTEWAMSVRSQLKITKKLLENY
jgi:hypothetical protein